MQNASPWRLRTENSCLFIDDISLGKVVLQHNARPGLRPYIHPLRIEDGQACLTEDSPWHHPWQHGIQTGFHGVNGCDFWLDPGQHPDLVIGTIEAGPPRIVGREPPCWEIEAIWRHADGSYLLVERQTWSLHRMDGKFFFGSGLDSAGDSRYRDRAARVRRPVHSDAVPTKQWRQRSQRSRQAG